MGAFQVGALQCGPGAVLGQPLGQGLQAFISGQLLLVIQARAIPTAPLLPLAAVSRLDW